MKLLLIFVVSALLAGPVWAADSPRALVLEHADRWTGLVGAAAQLERAGFDVAPLSFDKPPGSFSADLVLVGSFASEHEAYARWVEAATAPLLAFVESGGVLVQLTQADQTECAVPFLPEGLAARRCDMDFPDLIAWMPRHPLLLGMEVDGRQPPRLRLPGHGGHPASWETFERRSGFAVLVSADEDRAYPALLEAAHGRGRILLCSFHFDKVRKPDGAPAAPLDFIAASARFFSNLKGYVQMVDSGDAPGVEPTPPHVAPDPLPFVPGSWTLAVLPDTQNYAQSYPDLFEAQTRWIAENVDRYNIVYALHLGDVTNNNASAEWEAAQRAMFLLDGRVPYAIAPGNHDYGTGCGSANTRDTLFNDYFPLQRYCDWPTFGGVFEDGHLDNSYHLFSAGGADWLILALEWAPRDRTVAWANEVLDRHPDRRAIVITHAYLYSDDTRYDWAKYGAEQLWSPYSCPTAELPGGVSDGEDLWRDLIYARANVSMVICGHVLHDGLGRLASTGASGNTVQQMLVNYQMHARGGDAFLRLMEFLPDGRTVQVKAYSPDLDEYRTDSQNQFTFMLDPPAK